jgi:hypothetical protein
MKRYGTYEPGNDTNSSELFQFQEVPLTSSKLNVWNGNIDTVFTLFHQVCSLLASGQTTAVLTAFDDAALRIDANDPADMQLTVHGGWAVIQQSIAGSPDHIVIPDESIVAPVSEPRIDLVVLKNDGMFDVVLGDEALNPEAPEVPSDAIALAEIVHRVGSTFIADDDDGENSYLIDIRAQTSTAVPHQHAPDRAPVEMPDGTRTEFSTQYPFDDQSLDVYINGVLQEVDQDYTEQVDRQGYTFLSPPLEQYRIQHRYRRRLTT